MEDSVQERAVPTRPHGEQEVRRAADRRRAGVNHDDGRPVVPRAPEVVGQDRKTFADVRAGDDHAFRQGDVAPRIRRPVRAKRLAAGRAGRHHAEAAVVVDVLGAERHPRELPHQVGLLVRERRARQEREGIAPVFFLDAADVLDDEVDRFLPARLAEAALRADERREKAVGMSSLHTTERRVWPMTNGCPSRVWSWISPCWLGPRWARRLAQSPLISAGAPPKMPHTRRS